MCHAGIFAITVDCLYLCDLVSNVSCPIISVFTHRVRPPAQALAPTVKALLVLDAEGARICSKYYGGEWPTLDRQIALEKQLFAKTRSSRGDGALSLLHYLNF